jgi:hypothetical protein
VGSFKKKKTKKNLGREERNCQRGDSLKRKLSTTPDGARMGKSAEGKHGKLVR